MSGCITSLLNHLLFQLLSRCLKARNVTNYTDLDNPDSIYQREIFMEAKLLRIYPSLYFIVRHPIYENIKVQISLATALTVVLSIFTKIMKLDCLSVKQWLDKECFYLVYLMATGNRFAHKPYSQMILWKEDNKNSFQSEDVVIVEFRSCWLTFRRIHYAFCCFQKGPGQ